MTVTFAFNHPKTGRRETLTYALEAVPERRSRVRLEEVSSRTYVVIEVEYRISRLGTVEALVGLL